MEGGALLDRLTAVKQRAPGRWQIATVSEIKRETPMVKSFWLELPMWMAHCPGQHYDVRLTAPDGYRAQRSYSVASSPLDRGVIDALRRKDMEYLAGLDPRRLKAGSSEIRNWIVAAGAASDLELAWMAYIPSYRTPALTGIGLGFAKWS